MMFNRIYILILVAALHAPMAHGAAAGEYDESAFVRDMQTLIAAVTGSSIETITSSGSAAEAICTSRIKLFEDGGVRYISYFDKNLEKMVAYQFREFLEGVVIPHPSFEVKAQ